jgi:ribosomal protein S18 acetylase RimI-like enzyme
VRFDATDIGRRVTLRRVLAEEDGRMGDVVGRLDRWADGTLTVIKRSGEHVAVAEDTVVAGKVVAPEVASVDLQERCAADWTPHETAMHNGWTLRYHFGLNRRSCSVLALTVPEAPWREQVEGVRAWYAARGAPALVLTVEGSAVDAALASDSTPVALENDVMVGRVADVVAAAPHLDHVDFAIDPLPSDRFLALNTEDAAEREHLTSLLVSAPRARYATGTIDGVRVATGRVSPRDGWAGLTHLEVAEDARRERVGSALVGALAAAAGEAGAHDLWLQVERDNAAALVMYARLGFTRHHGYVYRVLS